MRKEYPMGSMASHEILDSLTEVFNIHNFRTPTEFQQGAPEYNAYERDIAVLNLFFGDLTAFGKVLKNVNKHILFLSPYSV